MEPTTTIGAIILGTSGSLASLAGAASADSHVWEIALAVVTLLLVLSTIVLVWATNRLTQATVQAANREMGRLSSEAIDDMRAVAIHHRNQQDSAVK